MYMYTFRGIQVSRGAEEIPSVDTVKKGYRKEMKTGFNKVLIDDWKKESLIRYIM